MARLGQGALVLVLNNAGYAIEEALHAGPYNQVAPWRYALLPAAWGPAPAQASAHSADGGDGAASPVNAVAAALTAGSKDGSGGCGAPGVLSTRTVKRPRAVSTDTSL